MIRKRKTHSVSCIYVFPYAPGRSSRYTPFYLLQLRMSSASFILVTFAIVRLGAKVRSYCYKLVDIYFSLFALHLTVSASLIHPEQW